MAKVSKENIWGKTVVTPPAPMHFQHVFEKQTDGMYAGKYDITLCPSKEQWEKAPKWIALREECERLAAEAGLDPKNCKMPYSDGDEKENTSNHGKMVVGASTKKRPDVVSSDPSVDADPDDVERGMWARFQASPLFYNFNGNTGIKLQLNNAQIYTDRDFEPLSAGERGAVAFSDDDDFPS